MKMSSQFLFLIFAVVFSACEAQPEESARGEGESVWSIDLIRLLPGGTDEYVANISDNWAQARDIALRNGDIRSFRAMMAQPDSTRNWDIILMTEYTDSSSWANREEIFSRIFESTEYDRIPTTRPSSELREFLNGGVVLKEIAGSRTR